MPLPLLLPAAYGTVGAALAADYLSSKSKEEKRQAESAAIDKFDRDMFANSYEKKKEIRNRNMADEAGEAETLNARAVNKADIADISNREAGLSAPSLRNSDQLRSMARQNAMESKYGPSQASRDEMGRNGMKKGGSVKMAKGGSVKSSASSRGDGCCTKGKTKGRML
jgi:Tfp pilus assembly protein FimT